MIHQTLNSALRFLRKEGLRSTIKRAIFVVFYNYLYLTEYIFQRSCNDIKIANDFDDLPISAIRVDRQAPIPGKLHDQLIRKFSQYRGAESVKQKILARIDKGAELWVLCIEDEIATSIWAFRGGFLKPFFFPIGHDEIVLFDAFTFTNFRGRALTKKLLRQMLHAYEKEGVLAFYLSIKTWNVPSIKSVDKAGFKNIGKASKLDLLGKPLIFWHKT